MTWGFELARRPAWHAAWATLLLFGLIHLSGWEMGICYGRARGLPECAGTMMGPAYALSVGAILTLAGLVAAAVAWRTRRAPTAK